MELGYKTNYNSEESIISSEGLFVPCSTLLAIGFFYGKNKMKFEIETHNGEPMVSSKNIAKQFNRPHSDVLKAIRKILAEGDFSLGEYIDTNNQPRPLIYLNERSALIAMPFIGGNKSKEGQIALVDSYLAYRAALNVAPPLTAAQHYLAQAQINVELEQTQIQQANEIAEIKDTVSTFSK